jgi:hypothetical protein
MSRPDTRSQSRMRPDEGEGISLPALPTQQADVSTFSLPDTYSPLTPTPSTIRQTPQDNVPRQGFCTPSRAYSEPEYGSIPPADPYVPPRESTTIENTLAQLDTMLANRTSLEDTLVSVMHGMRDSSVTRSFKKPKVSDPEIRREPTQDGRCPHAVRAGYQTSAQPLPQR